MFYWDFAVNLILLCLNQRKFIQTPEKEFAFFLCPLKNTPLALFWKYKLLSVRGNFIHSLLFSQFYADLIKI